MLSSFTKTYNLLQYKIRSNYNNDYERILNYHKRKDKLILDVLKQTKIPYQELDDYIDKQTIENVTERSLYKSTIEVQIDELLHLLNDIERCKQLESNYLKKIKNNQLESSKEIYYQAALSYLRRNKISYPKNASKNEILNIYSINYKKLYPI